MHDKVFDKDEAMLYLSWNDYKITCTYHREESYDEAYRVDIRSPKIFGNEDEHTIKWYVKVNGGTYDAYRCEVDGKDVDLSQDILYNRRIYNGGCHVLYEMITVLCN